MTSARKRKVVVAMSGGVDSSVVAALLRERGDEVVGVTLRMQGRPTTAAVATAATPDNIALARAVAHHLGVEHHELGCEEEFERQVLRPAWDEYARGRTPSACLCCNERIKLGLLWSWAASRGARAIATGHYARIERDGDGALLLRRGADPRKEQSYFLARLTPEQLARTECPLGSLTKPQVRKLASRFALPTAEQPESQDACLVGGGDSYADTLRLRFCAPERPGDLIDEHGRVVGRHPGVHAFTVGQRRGIGIGGFPSRAWVKSIAADSAAVTLTCDARALFARRISASQPRWLAPGLPAWPLACSVQLRYRHQPQAATLEPLGADRLSIELEQPARAVAPGQAAVFYRGDIVLGSAWIDAAE